MTLKGQSWTAALLIGAGLLALTASMTLTFGEFYPGLAGFGIALMIGGLAALGFVVRNMFRQIRDVDQKTAASLTGAARQADSGNKSGPKSVQ